MQPRMQKPKGDTKEAAMRQPKKTGQKMNRMQKEKKKGQVPATAPKLENAAAAGAATACRRIMTM